MLFRFRFDEENEMIASKIYTSITNLSEWKVSASRVGVLLRTSWSSIPDEWNYNTKTIFFTARTSNLLFYSAVFTLVLKWFQINESRKRSNPNLWIDFLVLFIIAETTRVLKRFNVKQQHDFLTPCLIQLCINANAFLIAKTLDQTRVLLLVI